MARASWVLDATFLHRLPTALGRKVLGLAERRTLAPRGAGPLPLLAPGERAAVMILAGQATRSTPGELNPERVDTGRLLGAGWCLGLRDEPPELLAESGLTCLVFGQSVLDGLQGGELDAVRTLFEALDELDYVLHDLERVLRREPTLRRLYTEQRYQLLQSAVTQDVTPLDDLVVKGRKAARLPLLLAGAAEAEVGQAGQLAFPTGSLLGVYNDWLGSQPRQPYRVASLGRARVLWLPLSALRTLAERNPWFRRASVRDAGPPRGTATLVHACQPGSGATTLTMSLAVTLALAPDNGTQHVAVLDFDGERTCASLGRTPVVTERFGGPCHVVDLQIGHDTCLITPLPGTDPHGVLDTLLSDFEEVLISHATRHPPDATLLEHVHTAVLVSAGGDNHEALPLGEHQRRIHAIRQPREPYPARRARVRGYRDPEPWVARQPMSAFVRIPWDPSCEGPMTGQTPLAVLASPSCPMARAAARLGRMIQGRSRGVALSGGGAWGFVHLGLLRALHEAGLAPDFVSGTSIGSVVGAVYCGGPQPEALDRLQTLETTRHGLSRTALACTVNSAFVGAYIESITGVQHIYQPEVPLLTVSADVLTNSRYVPWTGSLSDAVRAASSFPGLFAPFSKDGHRLVDGGVVENLPALALGATADFILASNCIPGRRDPDSTSMARPPIIGRFIDAASSLFLLMGQASRQDESSADYAFVPTGHTKQLPMDFARADQTAALGYRLAMEQMCAIQAAYESDLTTSRS